MRDGVAQPRVCRARRAVGQEERGRLPRATTAQWICSSPTRRAHHARSARRRPAAASGGQAQPPRAAPAGGATPPAPPPRYAVTPPNAAQAAAGARRAPRGVWRPPAAPTAGRRRPAHAPPPRPPPGGDARRRRHPRVQRGSYRRPHSYRPVRSAHSAPRSRLPRVTRPTVQRSLPHLHSHAPTDRARALIVVASPAAPRETRVLQRVARPQRSRAPW
jgi:hypothetical protein